MASSAHRRRRTASTSLRAAELALAAPQVIAHRLGRMARSGPVVSARDQAEFLRMGSEKVSAFNEAWFAMGLEMFQANQALMRTVMRGAWTPWSTWPADTALALFGAGLRPIHRTAMANAKRLSPSRMR